MGDSTHRPANPTANFTRLGTRESLRSRRAVVTHAGRTVAKSFARPGGRRRAKIIITTHDAVSTTRPVINHRSNTTTQCSGQLLRASATGTGIRKSGRRCVRYPAALTTARTSESPLFSDGLTCSLA